MDIYEYAMKMEKDGEKFYRELADNCRIEGITTIFNMLASEEVNHYDTLVLLKKQAGNSPPVKSKIIDNVKSVFVRMKKEKADINFHSSEFDSYKKALNIEEMSQKFYLDKAANAEQEDEKQIFLRLAAEEEKHLKIMENIVEFVARPEPGNWLENAEWHHLEEF